MEGLVGVGDLGDVGLEAEEEADDDENEDGHDVRVDGGEEDGDELFACEWEGGWCE